MSDWWQWLRFESTMNDDLSTHAMLSPCAVVAAGPDEFSTPERREAAGNRFFKWLRRHGTPLIPAASVSFPAHIRDLVNCCVHTKAELRPTFTAVIRSLNAFIAKLEEPVPEVAESAVHVTPMSNNAVDDAVAPLPSPKATVPVKPVTAVLSIVVPTPKSTGRRARSTQSPPVSPVSTHSNNNSDYATAECKDDVECNGVIINSCPGGSPQQSRPLSRQSPAHSSQLKTPVVDITSAISFMSFEAAMPSLKCPSPQSVHGLSPSHIRAASNVNHPPSTQSSRCPIPRTPQHMAHKR